MDRHIQITTLESLKELLILKNLPIDTWGKIRTIEHLYSEIIKNESHLTFQEARIIRNIEVVSLKILHKNKVLLQYKQIFQSGEEIAILKLPSEKMLVGERINVACTRLLK